MGQSGGQSNLEQRIGHVVFTAIDQVNKQLSGDRKIEKSDESTLVGATGKLDSLGLVNLIVALQQGIEEEFEIELSLRVEDAISHETSPFQTVGTLLAYLVESLENSIKT